MMKQQDMEWREPLDAFRPLAGREGAVLLHPGALAGAGEWSMIAAEPQRRIEFRDGVTVIDGERVALSPFEALKALHRERRSAAELECGAPFASGLVGFAGYECARLVEPTAAGPDSPYGLPDFSFSAYDAIAAFNRREKRAFLLGRSRTDIKRLGALLGETRAAPAIVNPRFTTAPASMSRSEYLAAVASTIDRIGAGEIFQANLSQRLAAQALRPFDPYTIFCAASESSSGPYGAYIHHPEADILSLSPERFFAARRRSDARLSILAEPIKGTRPRGRTKDEDERLLAELVADPKDRAENVMIADLTRNDLSKICEDGSVREEAVCEPVSHATVHHLVSRIGGVLKEGSCAAEALAALFPCGSVTGAPKVQSMKVIADVERTGRGPYCGAIGYIDDRGGAEMSVAIRLAIVEGARITIPVGGGVTMRSDPEAEYQETLDKARQFLRLLGLESAP